MDIGQGIRILKNTLDNYELSYYEYCEILRYAVVCIDISYGKGEEVTEELVSKACQDGLDFMKKHSSKTSFQQ